MCDLGCGEGYGAAGLARHASRLLALDYDAAAAGHAAATYPALAVLRGNAVALPLASGRVDTVVSLQVIEHLWDQPAFAAECLRVLRPGGVLVLTTPNREAAPGGARAPRNPFHSHEFTAAELAGLLTAAGFELVTGGVGGIGHGPRLRALDQAHPGGLVAAQLAAPAHLWSPRLHADVASVTAADFAVADGGAAPAGAGDWLDLFVVARRPEPA